MAKSVEMDNGGSGNQHFVFLTVNDFAKDGGGTVRMYGLLNALAGEGHGVTLISNAVCAERFHPAIRHINVGSHVSRTHKKILQGLMAWLPCAVVGLIYGQLLRRLKKCLEKCPHETDTVYSFEYLDNSLARLMHTRGYITHYVNDTHGMAAFEFDAQRKAASNWFRKAVFGLKRVSASRLDRKVFGRAAAVIYASPEMQHYYAHHCIGRKQKPDPIILPFVFGGDPDERPDPQLEQQLRKKYQISDDDFVFLFAGSYKVTSGVDRLIDAFGEIHADAPHTKLILIGRTGPLWAHCREKTHRSSASGAILFIDAIPYRELITYQQLAHVIVCPDRANAFSEYIVHTKYFDALRSGKPVISGRFASMRSIDPDERLSLSFDPHDRQDLRRVMEHSLYCYAEIAPQYANNGAYVAEHFTYRSFAGCLTQWNIKRKSHDIG